MHADIVFKNCSWLKTGSREKILAEVKLSERPEIPISGNLGELWSASNEVVTDLLTHLVGKEMSNWMDL